MDITLNNEEISQALTEYVGNQGIDLSDKVTSVDFTAGRGGNGNTATITISNTIVEEASKKVSKPRTTKPKKVSKEPVLKALNLDELDPNAEVQEEEADTTTPDVPEETTEEPAAEEATDTSVEPQSQNSLFG